ncbi:hypothetical protein [Alteromonas gilva]|uniref:Cyclic nucleotide-binding domain-containing protein n=1 Tax=Alteromonas gilva TaxID=2987522 RepID=A0ABT5L782_9ALTE|nr:hypothetical protein [Alteromonas gilva]MDC8832924.1 hypothetical protein [Alteromonas gilva]
MSYLLPRIQGCQDMTSAEAILATLNLNQLEHLDGEIYAHEHWFSMGASFMRDTTQEQVDFYLLVSGKIKNMIASDNVTQEVNENGVVVRRSTFIGGMGDFERLMLNDEYCSFITLDFCHGYWVNRESLKIVSFCEGDVVERSAADADMLQRDIDGITTWYKENY